MTELATGELVAAWAWSVILVVVTIAVHVTGITVIALVLRPFWNVKRSALEGQP